MTPDENVNIATGHAVVGQQIGGRSGVECFAWVRTLDGTVWLLVSRCSDGGIYSQSTDEDWVGVTLIDLNVAQTGPVVIMG